MWTITEAKPDQLRALNSATQYPSIPTYHVLGERGRLTEERSTVLGGSGDVLVTEKIDGTNARIVLPPVGVGAPLIGSRTELLHYLDDVIANPAQGIVEAVRQIAVRIAGAADPDAVTVVFGEVYGGKASAGSKNYSTAGAVGFRVFDVASVPVDVLDLGVARIAAWRDGGGQRFAAADALARFTAGHGLDPVPPLPGLAAPPASVVDTEAWLRAAIDETHAALDGTGRGRPEGVVVRTPDRARIAKIRFEDYERTLKARR